MDIVMLVSIVDKKVHSLHIEQGLGEGQYIARTWVDDSESEVQTAIAEVTTSKCGPKLQVKGLAAVCRISRLDREAFIVSQPAVSDEICKLRGLDGPG